MDRLELPKSKYQIHRQIESKNLSAFFITLKKGEIKYDAERISQTPQSWYDTKMDDNEWMEVSSDGIPSAG